MINSIKMAGLYRIIWMSRTSNMSGNGQYIFSLENVINAVDYLNSTCPGIIHSYECQDEDGTMAN